MLHCFSFPMTPLLLPFVVNDLVGFQGLGCAGAVVTNIGPSQRAISNVVQSLLVVINESRHHVVVANELWEMGEPSGDQCGLSAGPV
jgi:hypothetical protein